MECYACIYTTEIHYRILQNKNDGTGYIANVRQSTKDLTYFYACLTIIDGKDVPLSVNDYFENYKTNLNDSFIKQDGSILKSMLNGHELQNAFLWNCKKDRIFKQPSQKWTMVHILTVFEGINIVYTGAYSLYNDANDVFQKMAHEGNFTYTIKSLIVH